MPLRSDIDDGRTEMVPISVTVGGTPLLAPVWRSPQLIEGVVPARLMPGSYSITVNVGDREGVLIDGYTVLSGSAPRRALDITDTQVVGGPHVDFPLLVSLAEPWLRDVAHGGEVARPDGFDLYFAADATGTQRLAHEVERYDPGTGTLVAWVKIPALSGATMVYVHHGDATITTSQEDVPAVWAGYQLVMHLGDIGDASANTSSFDVMTSGSAVGQIAGSHAFDGVDDRIIVGPAPALDDVFVAGGTSEGWFFARTIGENGFGRFFDKGHTSGWSMSLDGTAQTLALVYGSAGTGFGEWLGTTNAVSFNGWHHAAISFNSDSSANDPTLYIDGVPLGVNEIVTPSGAMDLDTSFDLHVGNRLDNTRTFDGQLDELRLSTVVRDGAWIATQYRNQANPGSFYTIVPVP